MKLGIFFSTCLLFFTELWTANNGPQSILTSVIEATIKMSTFWVASHPVSGYLNFTQLATRCGQCAETYEVVTEDGYILTIFRIRGEKTPVLLFHGLAASSDSFAARGNTSLAITLATEGYDLWVGNNRGNLYGRRHVSLNPDTDKKFWDYSLHEIGCYDLAATIDFIRNKTGVDKISTIGHSQGTSAHFVLTSLRPEYNERIKVFIALAPISYMYDMPPPLSLLAMAGPILASAFKLAGIEELFRSHTAAVGLIDGVCSLGIIGYAACGLGLTYAYAGFDPAEIEPEVLPVFVTYFPCGISRKCLEHYNQIISRTFAQYDYGEENIVKYGCLDPPEYDLKSVKLNVALIVANSDKFATAWNAERLRAALANVVFYKVLEPKQWGHFEFIVGKNMPKYLHPHILDILEKYD